MQCKLVSGQTKQKQVEAKVMKLRFAFVCLRLRILRIFISSFISQLAQCPSDFSDLNNVDQCRCGHSHDTGDQFELLISRAIYFGYKSPGGRGEVLPYTSSTGMCHWKGYGFQAI